MLGHLPALARAVRAIILTETGGGRPTLSLPLAELVRLLLQSHACSATNGELHEQLALLAAEGPPGWYAHVQTARGTYARLDNRVAFQHVLAALRALKSA